MKELIILIIGAFIGTGLTYLFNKRSRLDEKQQNKKEEVYLRIILFMYDFINFDTSSFKIQKIRPELNSKEKILHELEAEYDNMILFASENVLLKTNEFIKNPSKQTFRKATIALRQDLWNLKTSKKLINLLVSKL